MSRIPDRVIDEVDAEFLLDARVDPSERRNLLREHPQLAEEGRRLFEEMFGPSAK